MEEEQRAQLEAHAQSLRGLKSEVQDKLEKEGGPGSISYSEGVHEAMDDMVKAMKSLASYLSPGKNQIRKWRADVVERSGPPEQTKNSS